MDLYTFIKLSSFTNRFILRSIPRPEDAFRTTFVKCKSQVRYSSIVTPRHLVSLTRRNVIPFSDNLRLSPNEMILCLDSINIIYSVFKIFSVSSFAASQMLNAESPFSSDAEFQECYTLRMIDQYHLHTFSKYRNQCKLPSRLCK